MIGNTFKTCSCRTHYSLDLQRGLNLPIDRCLYCDVCHWKTHLFTQKISCSPIEYPDMVLLKYEENNNKEMTYTATRDQSKMLSITNMLSVIRSV